MKELLGYGEHEIPNRIEDWGRLVHPDDAGPRGRACPGPHQRRDAGLRGRVSHAASRRQRPLVPRAGNGGARPRWHGRQHGRDQHPHHRAQARRGGAPPGRGDEPADRREHRRLRQDPRPRRAAALHQPGGAAGARVDGCQRPAEPPVRRLLRRRHAPGCGRRGGSRARRRPRAVPVPDAHDDRRAEVVGRRGDADHRHGRHRRPAARGVARRHRAPPRGDAPRRAASGAGADRHWCSAAGRAGQHRAPRRERGRRHGLHGPPARRRRGGRRARRGAQHARRLSRGAAGPDHRAQGRLLRHGDVPGRAGHRRRRGDRPALGGLPRSRGAVRVPRLLVHADLLARAQGPGIAGDVLLRSRARRATTSGG